VFFNLQADIVGPLLLNARSTRSRLAFNNNGPMYTCKWNTNKFKRWLVFNGTFSTKRLYRAM